MPANPRRPAHAPSASPRSRREPRRGKVGGTDEIRDEGCRGLAVDDLGARPARHGRDHDRLRSPGGPRPSCHEHGRVPAARRISRTSAQLRGRAHRATKTVRQEHDVGPGRQGPGDRHSLLHAADSWWACACRRRQSYFEQLADPDLAIRSRRRRSRFCRVPKVRKRAHPGRPCRPVVAPVARMRPRPHPAAAMRRPCIGVSMPAMRLSTGLAAAAGRPVTSRPPDLEVHLIDGHASPNAEESLDQDGGLGHRSVSSAQEG